MEPLSRVDGWEARLAALFAARMRAPFAWGINDCVTFGYDAVEALTEARIWPVTWSDAMSAARVLAKAGGLEGFWSQRLGAPIDNPLLARRGDIGLLVTGGRDTSAVCAGRSFCGPGLEHIEHFQLNEARLVWRIG